MVHLCVHLPKEAMLRGPVHYGWMYPVERRLLTCKRSVRNTARPEGSIAEAYVVYECLTFCSRYFDDIDTKWNRPGRNGQRDDSYHGDVSVFRHGVNFLGASQYLDAPDEYDKMVWFVLSSCHEVSPYIEYVIYCALVIVSTHNFSCVPVFHMLMFPLTIFLGMSRMYKEELNRQESRIPVDKRLGKEFAGWFKKR